ncbi:protein mono-ADP-ribosyltransferase PARP15-like [Saccostrea echinata]|uniref:protein mono-ADP-ribosyltransferase PARP15-like n=1 Tax=Saccostrea echinata TaxID=191078 RepID=UPI002A8238D2|nr:protein mono-ADP-ribosyltransferase PARP15-like [Saccostrea echinata]
MARRITRSASSGNLLEADDGTSKAPPLDEDDDLKSSFLPGLLGKRKKRLPSAKPKECQARFGRVKVTLKKGLVYEEEVDAIVNSTSQTLTLDAGNASLAMLEKTGRSIQEECKRKYPDGIKFGELAETGGGDLYCGYVFHGCLKYWRAEESNSVEQTLTDLVTKCLERGDHLHINSIAFPALGTGFLQFPAKIVVCRLLQCVKDFEMRHKSTNVTDIRFVIFPKDTKTFEEFENEFNRHLYSIYEKPTSQGILPTKLKDIECSLENLTVKLVAGCLVEQKVDVIVDAIPPYGKPGSTSSSKAILKAGGSGIEREFTKAFPVGIDIGDVVSSGSHKIQNVKKIYFGALPTYTVKERDQNQQALVLMVEVSLMKLQEDGFKTIAIPTLGVGDFKFPPRISAMEIFSSIKEYNTANKNGNIDTVYVVVDIADSEFVNIWKAFGREIIKIVPPKMKNKVPIIIEPKPKPPPVRGSRDWFSMMYEEELCVPSYWTDFKGGEKIKVCKRRSRQHPYSLVSVDQTTMYLVVKIVEKTWESHNVGKGADARGLDMLFYNNIRVTKVERVENLDLYESYVQERQRFFDNARSRGSPFPLGTLPKSSGEIKTTSILKSDKTSTTYLSDIYPEINEHYVFHGTLADTLDSVLTQGLDCRMSRSTAMFGQGAYGAESSTKADQYVDKKENRKKIPHQMLLVRMCLGDICLYDFPVAHRRAPCKKCRKDNCTTHKPKDFYDSVVADGNWLFREFIVFDKRQAYPEYLITYVRV